MPSPIGSSLALLLIAGGGFAQAAPATPEEAQRLTSLFQRYVGQAPGAVTVVPDGEAYVTSLDLGRLFAFLQPQGLAVTTAGNLAARLTPQTDGQWRVSIDGLPEIGAAMGGQASSIAIAGYKLDGLFDPAIQAFASASTQSMGSVSRSSGSRGSSTVRLTQTSAGSYGATDGGAGTIDVTSGQTTKDFAYDATVATSATGPDGVDQSTKFTAQGTGFTSSFTVGNARNAALNDLWAFLVAHASKAELVAHQAELKTRLKAMLPFASSAVADVTTSKLVVKTSLGRFAVDAATEHVEVDGPGAKDGVLTRLKLSGLVLPDGIIPSWAVPLTPTALDFTQTDGPLNLTPPLLALIDALDLGAEKPLTDDQVAAFTNSLAEGGTSVHIAPSTIATALMAVHFESDLKMTRPMPSGTATLAVTGLDKSIDAIRAASPDDPNAAQAIALMSSVKLLAKAAGPDSYSWHIEAIPGGDILVNGNPLGGGAPAAPRPSPRKKAFGP